MKRNVTIALCFGLIASLLSCDDDSKTLLSGSWENVQQEQTPEYVTVVTFTFGPGSAIKITRTIEDPSTREVFGYRYKGEGTYLALGNKLTINLTSVFVTDPDLGSFSPEAQLVEAPAGPTQEYVYNLEGDELTIAIAYCPPNADCIGPITYQRIE